MPLAVGAILALLVLGATTAAGMDRDRALYPAVTIVVASYYVLFAVLGGSMQALAIESAVLHGLRRRGGGMARGAAGDGQGPGRGAPPGRGAVSLTGGCFCGRVRYAIGAPLRNARSCHCSRCRKAFSGAGSAYAEVAPGSFAWTAGEELLSTYESAPGWGLAFCSRCGSTLCGTHDGAVHGVTLGCVDGDPGVQIGMHIFVGSRAPWDHIGGDAPRYDGHAGE